MAVSDYMKPGYGKKQAASIVTVDTTKRKIEAALKDGGRIEIAVWEVPPVFRWPKVGEVWTVRQDGGIWRLDSLIEVYEEAANTESLLPGQARIAATEIKTSNGLDLMVTDTDAYSDGQMASWDVTTKTFVPNVVTPHVATLLNGWVGQSAAVPPTYCLTKEGVVHVWGCGDGSSATNIGAFQLPLGMRPQANIFAPLVYFKSGAYLPGDIFIDTSGNVSLRGNAAVLDAAPAYQFSLTFHVG